MRAVFGAGSRMIAGCYVADGKIRKDSVVEIMRKGKCVHIGKLDSLRRVKDAVQEVRQGIECGVGLDNFADWKEGDIIKAFDMQEKIQTLDYEYEDPTVVTTDYDLEEA